MAFNPFTWFRKHQKPVFAVLILLTMFVFIGQFGQGDLFQTLLRSAYTTAGTGEVVATIGGKKVRESDLARIRERRRLASDYLFMNAAAAQQGKTSVWKELQESEAVKGTGPMIEVRQIIEMGAKGFEGIMRGQTPPGLQDFLIRPQLTRLVGLAELPEFKDNPENLTMLQRIGTLLGFQYWVMSRAPDGMLYFGGSDRPEDLLDFAVWQQQADRLGIQLTDADVAKSVLSEAAGADVLKKNQPFEEDAGVKDFIVRRGGGRRGDRRGPEVGPTARDLLEGLREEFRVVLARSIVAGEEPGVRRYRNLVQEAPSSPALSTPDEFLRFFRENRTTLKLALLGISADKYLDQVKKDNPSPAEPELRALFDLYRKQEPRTDAREPGFKEPRRVAYEYAWASPEDPFYRDQVAQQVKALVNLSKETGRLSTALAALAGPSVSLGRIALSSAIDPMEWYYLRQIADPEPLWFFASRDLTGREDRAQKLHYLSVLDGLMLDERVVRELDAYETFATKQKSKEKFSPSQWKQHGEMLTATLGSLAGATQAGLPWVGLTALYANATVVDTRKSLEFSLHQLTQADPALLFGSAAYLATLMPAPLTPAHAESQILAALPKEMARQALDGNIQTMQRNLFEERRKSEKAAADYLKKALAEYHFQSYRMPKALTRDAMREVLKNRTDPQLMRLYDAMEQPTGRGIEAALDQFFSQPRSFPGFTMPTTYAQLEEVRDTKPEVFLMWRTEDQAPVERTFEEARPAVQQAWYLDRARRLARAQANEIVKQINEGKMSAEAADAVLRKVDAPGVFELENVARLLPNQEVRPGTPRSYTPYSMQDRSMDKFLYPPADLAKQAMNLERPGQAMLVVDRPATHFYVTVLQERTVPTVAEFAQIYARTPREDSLHERFQASAQQEYRDKVLEQLRRDFAAPTDLDSEGRFKIPDEVRNRERGGSDE